MCSGIWCCTVPNTGDFSRHGCVVAFGVAQGDHGNLFTESPWIASGLMAETVEMEKQH